MIFEGLCVGNKVLTRALLTAPRVTLSERRIGWERLEGAAWTLSLMTSLRELDLSCNTLEHERPRPGQVQEALPAKTRAFLALQKARTVEALSGALAGMSSLHTLDLWCNNLRYEQIEALEPNIPSGLVHLSFGHNFLLGPDGAIALGPLLERLTNLEYLNLP
mmetsp:Transcript_57966/g.142197  ORF Transcript_57966/g.142197 Transcript_57966/m.142197 type:complete len:163 (+) Transcript_57966:270-758(+)